MAAHRLDQERQGHRRRGRDRHVARIAAHRIAREEGIDAQVNDRRAGCGLLQMRVPGHVGLDDHDRVGLGQRGVRGAGGVVAEVEIVPVGEVQVDRIRLHHADPARLGERDEAVDSARIDPRRRGEDDGVLGARQDARGLVDARRIGEALAAHLPARRRGDGHWTGAGGQDLTRQRQIDRPSRLGLHDLERPVDHGLELGGRAQLVVPLHVLAQHGGLVEALLRPVNVQVARAQLSFLGDRRAPGGHEHGDVRPGGGDDGGGGVAGADVDVDHHRGRPPAGGVVAVGHRDGDELVRDHQRARRAAALGLAARERLHERGEVGAGVAEEDVDASVGQELEVRLGRRHGMQGAGAHVSASGIDVDDGRQQRQDPRVLRRTSH